MNSVMSYETLAKSQQEDQELKTYLNQEKGLQLTPVKIPGSELYTPFGATWQLEILDHFLPNHFAELLSKSYTTWRIQESKQL